MSCYKDYRGKTANEKYIFKKQQQNTQVYLSSNSVSPGVCGQFIFSVLFVCLPVKQCWLESTVLAVAKN
jgi:hypothetical protein